MCVIYFYNTKKTRFSEKNCIKKKNVIIMLMKKNKINEDQEIVIGILDIYIIIY